MPSYADLRKDYALAGLAESDLARDPFRQFEKWFQEAVGARIQEPNAAVLSTASSSGMPSSRCVLLKSFDGRGFVFFSNRSSRKGTELAQNPQASLLFPWLALERQVLVEGRVTPLSEAESEVYFHSRPRASQLAACASQQSTVIASRAVLEEAFRTLEKRHAEGEVPKPPHWGGWRLAPTAVEFWQGRRSRLHDRLRFRLQGGEWVVERLAP